MNFDMEDIVSTEFLVVLGESKEPALNFVVTDPGVQAFLQRAATASKDAMLRLRPEPVHYDPSNLYALSDHLYIDLNDVLATRLKYLFDYENALPLGNTIEMLPKIKMYVAKLTDGDRNILMAVKKVSSFGKRLDKPGRIEARRDELILADAVEFELSKDFDFVMDSERVYIYHHMGFEHIGQIREAIKETIQDNITSIRTTMEYVNFDIIANSTSNGVKHARLLSIIKTKGYSVDLTPRLLEENCHAYGVSYNMVDGRMEVDQESHLNFLRILARQFLEIELREGYKERFFSPGREAL